MPAMPRPNKKAERIALAILGHPQNSEQRKRRKSKRDMVLIAQETMLER